MSKSVVLVVAFASFARGDVSGPQVSVGIATIAMTPSEYRASCLANKGAPTMTQDMGLQCVQRGVAGTFVTWQHGIVIAAGHEAMTTDPSRAEDFYAKLISLNRARFGEPSVITASFVSWEFPKVGVSNGVHLHRGTDTTTVVVTVRLLDSILAQISR